LFELKQMKSKTCLLFTCSWLAALLIYCAAESPKLDSTSAVPEALRIPVTESLAFKANAKGVQIYESRAKEDDPSKYEWVFKGPEADLFDEQGKKIGRHYAGPTWESNDGSKVVGEVKGKADAKDERSALAVAFREGARGQRSFQRRDLYSASEYGRGQSAGGM